MKGFEINFMQVRTYVLPEVFVKFKGKLITPRGFIISHGVNHLFKVSEGEKLLTEGMLLNSQAVGDDINAFLESFLLSNQSSLQSKNVLIVMNKFLQNVREVEENRKPLFYSFNPNIGMRGLKSLEEFL